MTVPRSKGGECCRAPGGKYGYRAKYRPLPRRTANKYLGQRLLGDLMPGNPSPERIQIEGCMIYPPRGGAPCRAAALKQRRGRSGGVLTATPKRYCHENSPPRLGGGRAGGGRSAAQGRSTTPGPS